MNLWGSQNLVGTSSEEENLNIKAQLSSGASPEQLVPKGYRQVPSSGYPQYTYPSQPRTLAQLKAQKKKSAEKRKLFKEVAEKRKKTRRVQEEFTERSQKFDESAFRVGEQVGQAAALARRQRIDFSTEQQALQQMFGKGEKIWGVNNTPVRINNDLHPSMSNPYDETSSMFGFGGMR